EPRKWKWAVLFLCFYGFMSSIRPGESFITPYLLSSEKNFTREEVTNEITPVLTYSYMAVLVPTFLLTDLLRYKPVLVIQGISQVVIWIILLLGTTLLEMQFMEFFYGITLACRVAYSSYIFSLVKPEQYQRVAGYSRSSVLLGVFTSSVVGQLCLSLGDITYYTLSAISLGFVSFGLLLALGLPWPKRSLFFNRMKNQEQKELAEVASKSERDHMNPKDDAPPRSSARLFGVSLEGYGLGPDAAGGTLTSFTAGFVKIEWNLWSKLVIAVITAVQAGLLLVMGTTDNIWTCYVSYILFRGFYQFLVPIATFQIASSLTKELCALVFGINTFLGTILKSIIILIFADKRGLALDVRSQFMVYFIYFTLLTVLYFVGAAIVIFRHYRNRPREGGGASGRPVELCPAGGESTTLRTAENEAKLDAFPQSRTPGSGRATSKSWQYRFFVLNNESGLLEYFVNEQSRPQKPRGMLPLAGAVISPSDEDSHTFTVNAISGEQYKLRASDAKERQHWVSRLQICTQHHTEAMGKSNPPLKSRSYSMASQGSSSSPMLVHRSNQNPASLFSWSHTNRGSSLYSSKRSLLPDHLLEAREMMGQAQGQHRDLIQSIEALPSSTGLSPLDQDLLMLKATSMATMNCLNECLHILHLQQVARQRGSLGGPTLEWLEPKLPDLLKNGSSSLGSLTTDEGALEGNRLELNSTEFSSFSGEHEDISAEDEVEDGFTDEEEDLGAVEEERSVILHLLSQLKLGMDLTRVVLPTFILEKRSLLEMYADFMSHPHLFVAITDGSTPEDRMVRFVEYYLTSFHEGRKGSIAKKPYNPIIGETFHCSWKVPRNVKGSKESLQGSADPAAAASSQDPYLLRFVAEQVSHHPPVSGFYAECQERQMCVNTHVWTKSKFMGMSIGVSMIGEGCLYLLEHDEEYIFTLPCAYARSILTVPWVELGGKVNIACAKSGYSAVITFQTKPFYGGKLHKVTAEVRHNSTNTVVCRVQGEWNGVLEFSYTSGETKLVDVTKLPVTKKRVRPIEKQGPTESRRLWQNVTESLREKDIEKATEHKRLLEERQRTEERHRAETETPWRTRHFDKEGEGWMYHKPLWKN
ncbi:unnamed protein product, partial [Tetraodon nigroviridis]